MNIQTQTIAERVRHYRVKQGMTIKELANLTNFSERFINSVEDGTSNIGIRGIHILSAALKVKATDLINWK